MSRIRSTEQRATIDKMHRLCGKVGKPEHRYRVELLCLTFKHDLVVDLTRYKLWDEGWEGLGERQWDACFEMGDAELVIAEVVERARSENFLEAIRSYCGTDETFARWLGYADRQVCLF